jgi:hypothetical protein
LVESWSLKEKSRRRGLGLYIAASNAADLKGRLGLADKADKQTGRLHEFVLELPDYTGLAILMLGPRWRGSIVRPFRVVRGRPAEGSNLILLRRGRV